MIDLGKNNTRVGNHSACRPVDKGLSPRCVSGFGCNKKIDLTHPV